MITFIIISILILTQNKVFSNNQIIEIYSDHQLINTNNNTITFKNNVICKHNNIDLNANTIIVTYNKIKNNLSTLKAYGHPVIINYYQEPNSKTSAQSEILYYNANNNTVTLTGNASIKKSGHSIYSHNIVYFINQKKIQITSKKEDKITTILSINSLKNK